MKHNFRKIVLLSLGLLTSIFISCFTHLKAHLAQPKTDLLIFSYDRPMQLYALLESVERFITGLDTIQVILRTSCQEYTHAYQDVAARFAKVNFIHQGTNPREDFKQLTLQALVRSPNPYIIFAVDDNIVTDSIDLTEAITLLEKTNAYAFYFRLGTNLSYCYPVQASQACPPCTLIKDDVYSWNFRQGKFDWSYPNTLDVTLYRKKEILSYFEQLSYYSPNSLESLWAGHAAPILSRHGLCYTHTKAINIPLNRVQNEIQNIHMHSYTPQELLVLFNKDLKIDISCLYRVTNKSAHMPYIPTFIPRDSTTKID